MAKNQSIKIGRPKDRSFEAYKKFILGMMSAIAPNAKKPDDAKLRKSWKIFWDKADAAKKNGKK